MTKWPNQDLLKKFNQHSISMVLYLCYFLSQQVLSLSVYFGDTAAFFLPSTMVSWCDSSPFLTISWCASDDYGRTDIGLVLHGLVLLPFRCQLLRTWRRSWRASVPWNRRPVNFCNQFPPCSTSERLPMPCRRTSFGKGKNATPAGDRRARDSPLSPGLPSDCKRPCCLFWKLFLIGWLIVTMINLQHFKVLFI